MLMVDWLQGTQLAMTARCGALVASVAMSALERLGPGKTLNTTQKGTTMNINADQAKGRVKQAVGDLTGDERLKGEGEADEAAGKAKKVIHDVEKKAEELVDKVKNEARKD
jgi:uncharacterized protein YjbJ (UPF0337 family)